MKKEIIENEDGTFTAVAGVRIKDCDTREEAESFLQNFLGRRHSDPVANTYDRSLHKGNEAAVKSTPRVNRWVRHGGGGWK